MWWKTQLWYQTFAPLSFTSVVQGVWCDQDWIGIKGPHGIHLRYYHCQLSTYWIWIEWCKKNVNTLIPHLDSIIKTRKIFPWKKPSGSHFPMTNWWIVTKQPTMRGSPCTYICNSTKEVLKMLTGSKKGSVIFY